MSFIYAKNLTKHYGKGQSRVQALRGVGFAIKRGEFVAMMGPSGSGKSTLLGVLGGINSPSRGSYVVDGMDIYGLSSDQRADFRREYLGFVFQNFNLVPYLTLLENVMLPLATKKLAKSQKREMAAAALDRVGLGEKLDRLPGQASGGEQERAAVARALVFNPPVLLADEPTGNLDHQTSQRVMALIGGLNQDGMTVIMVTHSPECAQHAGRRICLGDGLVTSDEPGKMASLEAVAEG